MAEVFGAHFVWIIASVFFVMGFVLGLKTGKKEPISYDVPSLDLVNLCRKL